MSAPPGVNHPTSSAFGASRATPEQTVLDLPGRVPLAVRHYRAAGTAGTAPSAGAVLVHGLASNARLWDGVAPVLARGGVEVVAVDLRGHGASADLAGPDTGPDTGPNTGHDTATAAADVAAVVALLVRSGVLPQPIVLAGQSWGGNVVLTAAAEHPAAADAIALLDGGWLRLPGYPSFDDAWQALAPPTLGGARLADVASRLRAAHPDWPETGIEGTVANLRDTPEGARSRLGRDQHRSILRSLYEGDPRPLYPRVRVPALLMPAGDRGTGPTALVGEAEAGLSDVRLAAYPEADHDLHAQFPERVAADLLELTRAAGAALPTAKTSPLARGGRR